MGMIKLPNESLVFFNKHSSEIFKSGELAEGKWNQAVADWECNYSTSSNALAVNSNGASLLALLKIIVLLYLN